MSGKAIKKSLNDLLTPRWVDITVFVVDTLLAIWQLRVLTKLLCLLTTDPATHCQIVSNLLLEVA